MHTFTNGSNLEEPFALSLAVALCGALLCLRPLLHPRDRTTLRVRSKGGQFICWFDPSGLYVCAPTQSAPTRLRAVLCWAFNCCADSRHRLPAPSQATNPAPHSGTGAGAKSRTDSDTDPNSSHRLRRRCGGADSSTATGTRQVYFLRHRLTASTSYKLERHREILALPLRKDDMRKSGSVRGCFPL